MFLNWAIKKDLRKLIIFICALPFIGYGQSNIPTGSWRTHYSFNSTITISQSSQNIFAASGSGLYIVDKNDKSIYSLTKLNGLTETGITQIGYNSNTEVLVITYENGQIDLLKNNEITSIPDIKLSDIILSKITHHINAVGIYTYLSTDFGLIQLDTDSNLIRESFLNLSSTGDNLKIFASTVFNDSIFLATESGVMAGSLTENLKDFAKWKRFDLSTGINEEEVKVIDLYEGKPLVGNANQGLLTYDNGMWTPLGELIGSDFTSIETDSKTLITASGLVYELNGNALVQVESSHIINANTAVADANSFWVADNQNGLVNIVGTASESIYPNGPFFNDVVKLKSLNNKIYAFPNFRLSNGQPARNQNGFSVFEDGIWSNYNSTGYPNTSTIPVFYDISGVSKLASGATVFSSFGYGLLKWDNDAFEIIDESNSPLINSSPPDRNVLIPDIASDNTNLWILNNDTNTSLHALTNNNVWSSFTPVGNVAKGQQIVSTLWGDQWISISSTNGGGIIVYGQSDGEIALKSNGVGTIPSNAVNQMVVDQEDKMWIATNRGVVYYLFPHSIISDPSQEAIVPIIDSQLLFNNEKVNTLAVDGGNRIWMGTNKGAWLFEKDGSVLIEHFTAENSPLLSDVVTNIAINHQSGEVFFNTDKGLISYKGTATLTGKFKKPKIFPNPVNPGYTGVITIEGVPANAMLKITDASGRLVANINANGNTAVWDLKNEYSTDIGSGVYFVFISSDDGRSTQLGKIAIVK